MRTVEMHEKEAEALAFGRSAMEEFAANPELATFGDAEPGGLIAIRWGLAGQSAIVLQVCPDSEILIIKEGEQ